MSKLNKVFGRFFFRRCCFPKKITDNWKKLNKKKLFLKTGKPSKKLEKWIEEFDSIVTITQNLMWTRETTKNETLNEKYSLKLELTTLQDKENEITLLKNTILEIKYNMLELQNKIKS